MIFTTRFARSIAYSRHAHQNHCSRTSAIEAGTIVSPSTRTHIPEILCPTTESLTIEKINSYLSHSFGTKSARFFGIGSFPYIVSTLCGISHTRTTLSTSGHMIGSDVRTA